MKDLIEINIDVIRDLKQRGLLLEANKLLNTYYKNKKENIIEGRRNIAIINNRIIRMKNKRLKNEM